MAKTTIPVPRSDAQAETQLARIGVLERDIAAAKVTRDEAVALLEAQHAGQTKPLQDELAMLCEGLEHWAIANRARLTENGKRKSAQLATGKISWKDSARVVEIEGSEAEIVAAIQKRIDGLDRKIANPAPGRDVGPLLVERTALQAFIREKTELNKAALKDRPEIANTIRGVRIVVPGERFTIAPLASQIREVA